MSDIKLICVSTSCPNCNKDIWLDIGQHDGMGGTMDMVQYKECHRCGDRFKLDTNGMITVFHTIEELTTLQFEQMNN